MITTVSIEYGIIVNNKNSGYDKYSIHVKKIVILELNKENILN